MTPFILVNSEFLSWFIASLQNSIIIFQEDVRFLRMAQKIEENRKLEKFNIIKDVPSEYALSFPFDSIEEVKHFSQTLEVNNLPDGNGGYRIRKLDLVSNSLSFKQ